MAEQDYFKKALSNFTYDIASGGAIRHLADLGYTVKQITEQLSFPTPYERVQKAVWEHFLDTEVLLLEEPGNENQRKKFTYVRDYDKYGKTSFRRVELSQDNKERVLWKEYYFHNCKENSLAAYLAQKCIQNGEETAYVSCDFGLQHKEKYTNLTEALDAQQREYILGIPWERKLCYHRLNKRMREIISRLHEQGIYQGTCYFTKLKEKVIL